MRRGGFTILELLLTLLVLALFAAFAIPAFFSEPVVTLENAAVLLARDLRMAQNRAAYMAEETTFVFLENGDGYRVLDPEGKVIENPATSLDFVRHYSEDGVFQGVRVLGIEDDGDRSIRFDVDGRAGEGIRVTLGFENDTRAVIVESGSGSITIVGSTSGWVDNGY